MSELTTARTELDRLKGLDIGKEELIEKALVSLNRIGDHYKKADAKGKVNLVGSIFSEMIEFDGNQCRTPKVNEAAALCLSIDGRLRGNKKGTVHEKMKLSPLVAREGIEPTASRL